MKEWKLGATAVSLIFHPLGVPTLALVFLLWANPYAFGVNRIGEKWQLVFTVAVLTMVIPAISVLLMRLLHLVEDLRVSERMQRIGPYIASGIFYSWLSRNLLASDDIPIVFTAISLGCTIAIFLCFVINVQFKISLHTVGASAMTAIFLLLWMHYPYANAVVAIPGWGAVRISVMTMIFLSVLVAGLVGTARLILGIHRPSEVYWGYLAGFISPFLGLHLARILG